MQLIKFLAQSGIASRRSCEELIKTGKIYRNNHKVTDPTYLVQEDDVITYRGQRIVASEKVYILLNKPSGYITSKKDEQDRKLVTDLLPEYFARILDPVGRLDCNTSGALLLTNDGQTAYHLTHPKFAVKKTYLAILSKSLTEEYVEMLKRGIMLSDGFVKPDKIYWNQEHAYQITITIHSGKNRIIRRLLEHIGFFVKKLHRKEFAGISLKNLPIGAWRKLTEKEIKSLLKTKLDS